MQKKLIGYLAILVGLLILAGIIYIIFFHKFSSPAIIDNSKTINTNSLPSVPEIIKNEPEKKIEEIKNNKSNEKIDTTQITLKKLAASFAERFGTYSNQSNYANLEESLFFMTEKMRTRETANLNDLRSKTIDYSNYNAITTKTVACNVTHVDGTIAEVSLGAIRTEMKTGVKDQSYPQNATIKLIKENNEWKIDEFVWQ